MDLRPPSVCAMRALEKDVRDHFEWLRIGPPGRKLVLKNHDLRLAVNTWEVLTKANLAGADFRETELRGAQLPRLYAPYADFRGADLRGANLRWSILRGVDFSGADLTGADLYGTDLSGANLRGADMSGPNHAV